MYIVLLIDCFVAIFIIGCMVYAVRCMAAHDLLSFCRYQVDKFPVESVYLLSKKDIKIFRFMFAIRVLTGDDKQQIRDAIVKLKGPRGQILQQAYDFAVNRIKAV